jgi:hypothetical protein
VQKANHVKKNPTIEGMFKGNYPLFDRKSTNSEYVLLTHKGCRSSTNYLSPLESLYALTSILLLKSYETPDQESMALGLDLVGEAVAFISRAPPGLITPLKQLQEGLGVWAKDPSHKLSQNVRRSTSHCFSQTHELQKGFSASAATKLWETILQAVRSLPRHDTDILLTLNVLLSSGFESWRKGTVNATIKLWNDTFGKQPSLNYTSRLQTALAKLKTVADLSLPGFPESNSVRKDSLLHIMATYSFLSRAFSHHRYLPSPRKKGASPSMIYHGQAPLLPASCSPNQIQGQQLQLQ